MTSQTGLQVPVPPALDRCRSLVEPALTTAVRSLHPLPRLMTSFSLGWCDADGRPTTAPGGKGIRQALAVLGTEAVGAPGDLAVPAAVAVELVHTFSLVHDDIMDGDERRRHQESAWKAFGTGPAVLTGDALFALAVSTLAGAGGDHSGAAVRHLAEAMGELVHGQADDLVFESRPWTGPDAVGIPEYQAMAARKTGALLGCSAALGPVLAGAPPLLVGALSEAGRQLGLAFQAVDDLLGIWGDPAATGKPVHSDLRRRKKTLPVLAAMALDPAAARHLVGLLDSGIAVDADDAYHAAAIVEEAGGREFALEDARRHVASARECLRAVPLAERAADELVEIAEYLLDRRL
ncbi:polyprenyl synthetase family protein [Streptomyces albireticuli]|uniref:Polyprenyl diphosphate synthase n=1 Tax=Streptomyces albireticuli TaxID=1940 RepID=A0A2A2D567_9ACTN|nr:polyprenyl synthetase family protein [Streptomyces albireticuli]MCD9194517.1 polyprenyl synthetase family protein [Streptomyces albireticuli]PAU46665.1 polyprenyl diphosphate synthase [Streptomyces albireticuli]